MEHKQKRIITLGVVVLCFALLSPAGAFANMLNSSNMVTYTSGGTTISMNSNVTEITFNGYTTTTSWTVFEVTAHGLVKENFSNYQIKRIQNAYQNTVSRIVWNHDVKVAEIYAFGSNQVYSNLVIKNLKNNNTTFISDLVFNSARPTTYSTLGFSDHNYRLPIASSKSTFEMINANSWAATGGPFKVSWQNEMALFHSGLFEFTPSESILSLPFGSFSLLHNASYSVGPTVISPNADFAHSSVTSSIPATTSPTASPMIIPIGGGGGGGSGGGSTGSPPKLSSVDGDPNSVMTVGQSITVTVQVSSVGSGGNTLKVYARNYTNGNHVLLHTWYSVDSTGPWSYTFNAFGGKYSGFYAHISNSYGSSSVSNTQVYSVVSAFPTGDINQGNYVNPGDTVKTIRVYDSNSNTIGLMSIGLLSQENNYAEGTTNYVTMSTGFLPLNSTDATWNYYWSTEGGLNYFSQQINWKGDSAGDTVSSVNMPKYDPSGVNFQVASSTTDYSALGVSMIYSAVTVALTAISLSSGLFLAFLGPLFLEALQSTSGFSISTTNNNSNTVRFSYEAGYPPPIIGEPLWNLIQQPDGSQDWVIQSTMTLNWYNSNNPFASSVTSTNPIVNYFGYSTNLGIVVNDYNGPYISQSMFEPFYLGAT